MTTPGTLTLNMLLAPSGLDLARTRLVRHAPLAPHLPQLLQSALAGTPDFINYQRVQRRGVFRDATHIVSTFQLPRLQALFIGVWRIDAEQLDQPSLDPFHSPGQLAESLYDLSLDERFDGYRGRLVLSWGQSPSSARSWIQRADRQDKEIVELRSRTIEPWPGFDRFRTSLAEVAALPLSWQEVLSRTGGIYLLVDQRNGAQYVGAAYGIDGFYGRWLAHLGVGGDAVQMRNLDPERTSVCILETAPLRANAEEILLLEVRWKERLGSRAHGLNAN